MAKISDLLQNVIKLADFFPSVSFNVDFQEVEAQILLWNQHWGRWGGGKV